MKLSLFKKIIREVVREELDIFKTQLLREVRGSVAPQKKVQPKLPSKPPVKKSPGVIPGLYEGLSIEEDEEPIFSTPIPAGQILTAKTSKGILEQYAQMKAEEVQMGNSAEQAMSEEIDSLIREKFGV